MVDKKILSLERVIIASLAKLGEECVNEARDNGGYNDQTGNLRSSIGYVIVANGVIVKSNFKTVEGGEDGVTEAWNLADAVAPRFKSGFALIVVAGMDYAFHVETMGKNVLSSAEHYAQSNLPAMLAQLKKKVK